MKIITEEKKCKICSKIYKYVPDYARAWIEKDLTLFSEDPILGYLWECGCKNTMFVPTKKVKEIL